MYGYPGGSDVRGTTVYRRYSDSSRYAVNRAYGKAWLVMGEVAEFLTRKAVFA